MRSPSQCPVKGGPAYVKAGGYIFRALALRYELFCLTDLLPGEFRLAAKFDASRVTPLNHFWGDPFPREEWRARR
jgi:hypothetical protein